jgi:hypothetical protein
MDRDDDDVLLDGILAVLRHFLVAVWQGFWILERLQLRLRLLLKPWQTEGLRPRNQAEPAQN